MWIGVIGLLVSLASLMYFAYRGINVLILAPLCALLALAFQADFYAASGQGIALATYTQVFMTSLGGYLVQYFPLFLLGSIFGKLMDDSGAALAIGQKISRALGASHAILATVLACAVLTYGGVSLFVVAFCVYPIAAALFEQAGLEKKFIPGSIALGAFTFTMTALPGTPTVQNAIPMPFFGTTSFAAPGLGTIAGIVMFALGVVYLRRRSLASPTRAAYLAEREVTNAGATSATARALPSFWVALLPLVIVIALNLVYSYWVIPAWNTAYLAEPRYGATELKTVKGIWAILIAVIASIAFMLVAFRKHLKSPVETVNEGTMGSLLPIFNTASEVGYGSVIASLAAFAVLKNGVLGIFPSNPLVSEAVAVNALAGITGSASGGLSIALKILGAQYLEMGNAMGVSPELLHRVASLSSGGFDTLPHNGAVISLLTICRMNHRQSYRDIFVVACAIPAVATITVIVLGTLFGSF